MEPVINEFMPDIAMGVSAMTLKERRPPEVSMEVEPHDTHPSHLSTATAPPTPHCHVARHPHTSRKRHAVEPKPEVQSEYPDLYEFSGRHVSSYAGPDLYSHSRALSGGPVPPPSYAPDAQQHPCRPAGDHLRLDVLEQPPQRLDLALVSQGGGAQAGAPHHGPRGRAVTETDLTCGLGPSRHVETYEDWPPARRPVTETMAGGSNEESVGARDRRSPSKPEYPYRKSAL